MKTKNQANFQGMCIGRAYREARSKVGFMLPKPIDAALICWKRAGLTSEHENDWFEGWWSTFAPEEMS